MSGNRTRLCFIAGTVLLLLTVPPATAQKDKKKDKDAPPPDYYPLKVGHTWVYRVGGEKVTIRVSREEVEGKDTFYVLEATGADVTLSERVSVRQDGVYRHSAEGMAVKPPLCFLQLPAKAGSSWKVASTSEGLDIRGTFTLGEEEVTVPAGKFRTVTSACPNMRIDRLEMDLTYWFAPGVGMVKQRLRVGDKEILLELDKFTPAK
jgi:hypothetical protein